jgi:hypothetical protein
MNFINFVEQLIKLPGSFSAHYRNTTRDFRSDNNHDWNTEY